MALFSPQTLRAMVLTKFPAQVVAGDGITITKAGRVYTFAASPANLGNLINALTEQVTLDYQNDFFPFYDASAGAGAKMRLEAIATAARAHPGYASNRYFIPGTGNVHSASVLAVTANRLYATPIVIGKRTTWTRIGIDVTVLAVGNARLGIFTTGTDGLPGTLVLDAGTVDTGSTGVKEITIAQSLPIGFYYLVAVFNATPTVRVLGTAQTTPNLSEYHGTGTPGVYDHGLYRAFVYAALSGASPFGTPTYGGDNPIMTTLRVV